MRALTIALGFVSLLAAEAVALDTFDRHTSFWVKQAAKKSAAAKELSSADVAKLALLEAGISSPCVVVQTNEGNWTKALVSWAFRKVKDKPMALLVIDRYVTYDRDRGDVALVQGQNVMLFPGFEFDFDIGQVVPKDSGADVSFSETRRLVAQGGAKLYGVNGSLLPPAKPDKYDPNDHPDVRPRDFAGTWRVNADGRWTGTWQIGIDDEGNVTGQYTSDTTKSTFAIKGRMTMTEVRHRLRFEIDFAAAQQQYDLYLWTTDKQMMAGTTTLINRTFGVFAVRETDSSAAKPVSKVKQSAIQRLKKPISLKVDREALAKVAEILTEKAAVPIRLRVTDLRVAGISPQQLVTLDVRDKPGDEVLRGLLKQAAANGQLVYLFERRGERESIAITTRRASEKRGERLPLELREPLAERMKRKLTLRAENVLTHEEVFDRVGDALGTDVVIRTADLPEPSEEAAKMRLEIEQSPATEFVPRLLKLAYPEADPVYVISKIDGEEFLVLTTRAAAEKRGEKLPKD